MTLSREESRALDELMAAMLVQSQTPAPGDDLLSGLTGVPAAIWKERLMGLLARKDDLQAQFLRWARRNPMDSAFVFLGASAAAFYQAERGVNPKINSYVDAFYYIATCASVGYADIFAVTQSGKSIAALVMIVGPSLTAGVLGPRRD
jgi:hypothetical protein